MEKRREGKRKKGIWIVAVLLCAAGIAVLTYPHVAQWQYKQHANQTIRDFDKAMLEIQNDGPLDALRRLMEAYNRELFEAGQSELKDPFSYQTPGLDLSAYGFDENIVGYLEIPRMEIHLPIYLGASSENMKLGAGHLTQTSFPIGGASTNAVFAAHRGMSTAAMFRDIEALEVGDPVYVTNFWEKQTYQVVETKVVLPTDVQEILIQPGRDLVTLITCHPYRANSHRYVVYCERA